MKQDNRGMSLVELIVVIAILSVLVSAGVNITGFMNGKHARECAYKIDAALANVRMETMSKSTGGNDVFLTLKQEGGEFYGILNVKGAEKKEKLGSNRVQITAYVDDSDTGADVDETGITFYFDRATGAVKKDAVRYRRIQVTQGAVVYEVTIEPATGKFSYERIK